MPKNLNKEKLSKINTLTETMRDLEKKKIEINNNLSKNNKIKVNIYNQSKITSGKIQIIKKDSNNCRISSSATMKNIYDNNQQNQNSKFNMAKSQGKFITFDKNKKSVKKIDYFDSYSNISTSVSKNRSSLGDMKDPKYDAINKKLNEIESVKQI